MPDPQRLDVLRQLREAAQLTQAEMALICGLRGRRSHQTAGAWERGMITPHPRRRRRFIRYLWDDLGLRRDPARFQAVWQILVEEWKWLPIDAAEWATFTRTAPPPPPSIPDEQHANAQPHDARLPDEEIALGAVRRPPAVVLYRAADAVYDSLSKLFGRDELLAALHTRLDAGEAVLLHGVGGVGKTALAATVAAVRMAVDIAVGDGPVLRLHAGTASSATLFTALVEHFVPPPERAALRGPDGLYTTAAVAELLAGVAPRLVVADDVWNGAVLDQLRQVLPPNVPLLATARVPLPRLTRIEVGNLIPDAAAAMLAHSAERPALYEDNAAAALCALLDFHPYALAIAGALLAADASLMPAQLRQAMGDVSPRDPAPADVVMEGRTAVKLLLDYCDRTLAPTVQAVWRALARLYVPGATATLLAEVSGEVSARDVWAVETALRELHALALVRQPKPGYYELHDLTFGYLLTLDGNHSVNHAVDHAVGSNEMLAAVARYVEEHSHDLATLALDEANVLAAADAARIQERRLFLAIMGELAQGGYIDARGHTQRHLALLDEAIALTVELTAEMSAEMDAQFEDVDARDAVDTVTDTQLTGVQQFAAEQARNDEELRHVLLSKRGNAYVTAGDFGRAVEMYEAALACAPSTARRILLEAVLGKTHALAGNHEAAARCFQIATQWAEAHNDIESLCTVLMQQSQAAAQAGDFAARRNLALRGVQLSTQYGRTNEVGHFYLNLGTAEFEIGLHAAVARHQDAYTYALRVDNEALLAAVHYALGLDYLGLEDVDLASSHLAEALRLFDQVGHADEAERVRRFIAGLGTLADKLDPQGDA